MASSSAPKTTAPPAPAPTQAAPQASTPAGAAGPQEAIPGNAAFGMLADGGFVAKLGAGLRLSAEELSRKDGVDLGERPQPVPGLRLTKATWSQRRNRLEVDADLRVPHVEGGTITIRVDRDGRASFQVRGALKKRVSVPALGDAEATLSLDENGRLGGGVSVTAKELTPRGLRGLTVTGGGALTVSEGRLSGSVDATLAFEKLGAGEMHVRFDEAGKVGGEGHVTVSPPFLGEARVDLAVDEAGNLKGTVELAMTQAVSPIPALSLTGGTLKVDYENAAVSGSLTDFTAAYRGLATATASAEIQRGAFAGSGQLDLAVPGLDQAQGRIAIRNGAVSGELTLAASAFPEALPVEKGKITATLSEAGGVSLSGDVTVGLGPAGQGQLQAAYTEAGEFSIAAAVDLTVPGLQGARLSVTYANGDLSGEAQVPIDTALIPGLDGSVTVRYAQGRWSGETEIGYSADNGKLSGRVTVTVAQTEEGALQIGGSGSVTAQLAPRLQGDLTATILPEGGIDVSGAITVTEPLELFPEKRLDKELFKLSQNIPLWAILVAVIRVRAGVRAGVGPGVFRNIKVEGSYTLGAEESDPSFSISGELFIPAFIEGYVAFGAGLGLDVALGSLTGGIEAVGTAGLYGAISVEPQLLYTDGDWAIEGVATLAAGARLKLGLNAWAEIEALWVTVWEKQWELGAWMWDVGPDLALQAKMNYRFGKPEPPQIEFSSSDIDSKRLIQDAMPKDGPKPSGARDALKNKAEWKGQLQKQRQAEVPSDLARQAGEAPPAPKPAAAPAQGASPAPGARPPAQPPPPPAGAGAAGPGAKKPEVAAPTPEPGRPTGPGGAVAEAAKPDRSAGETAAPGDVPTTDEPRYPGPVTLKTLEEPPAPLPRTADQEREDVRAAETALKAASAAAPDSEALATYFPRIKNRFRLTSLGYVGDFKQGFRIEGGINPQLAMKPDEKLRGTGVPGDTGGKQPTTEINWQSGKINGVTVGMEMIAKPLGPDHPLGTEPSGQQDLMDDLPGQKAYPQKAEHYIRGHLLNHHIGGPGKDYNLFPITGQANADHLNLIESTVKKWVNEQKYWTFYKVAVVSSGQLVKLASGLHAVDAVFDVEASTLNVALDPVETRKARIVSRYDTSKFKDTTADTGLDATDTASSAAKPQVDPTAGPVAQVTDPIKVQLPSSAGPIALDAAIHEAVRKSNASRGRAKTRELLLKVDGMAQGLVDVLFEAYDEVKRKSDKTVERRTGTDRAPLTRINGLRAKIVAAL